MCLNERVFKRNISFVGNWLLCKFHHAYAPSDMQTRKVSSIYYAKDDPRKPKSHDWGKDAAVGKKSAGLLMIQGPLGLRCNGNIRQWKIENGGWLGNNPPTKNRVDCWFNRNIRITGFDTDVFIRLYTHGTQEYVMKMLFDDGGYIQLFSSFDEISKEENRYYLSATEDGNTEYSPRLRGHLLIQGASN